MTADAVAQNARPARASAVLATLVGLAAVGALATAPVRSAMGLEALGFAVVAGGVALVRTDRGLADLASVAGVAVGAVGVVVVSAAVALVWVRTSDLLAVLQFVPGMLGAFVLALGVLPIHGGGSRTLVKAGTALVFLSVLLAGIVQRPGTTALLTSGVATVVAWDAGENAVGIGAQLGRRAETWSIELSHLAATVGVGVVAILAARTVDGFGTPGLPTTEFAVLIVGLVLLAAALHD